MRRAIVLHGSAINAIKQSWSCRFYTSQVGGESYEATGQDAEEQQHYNDPDFELQVDPSDKTVKTAIGKLPVSPLMDPAFLEARRRYKMPKRVDSPTAKKSKFRRALDRNPYAQALATPFRICGATSTGLPRYFLQDFHLTKPTEDGKPWWLPYSLEPSPVQDVGTDGSPSSTDADPSQFSVRVIPSSHPATSGRSAYFLARQDLLRLYRNPGPNSRGLIQKHLPDRPAGEGAIWREDMDIFVLEAMRWLVVQELVYIAKLCEKEGRGYVVPCQSWDEVHGPHLHHRCVLWLGAGGNGAGVGEEGPKPYATLDVEGRINDRTKKLAVFNLPRMLGMEHLATVRDRTEMLRQGSLFLLCRVRTGELLLRLWKLQGYMAEE